MGLILEKIHLELNLRREDYQPLSETDFKVIFLSYLNNPYFKIAKHKRQKELDMKLTSNIVNTDISHMELGDLSALDAYMYFLYAEKYTYFLNVTTRLIQDKIKIVITRRYLQNKEIDILTFLSSHLLKRCIFMASRSIVKDEINLIYAQRENGNENLDIFDIEFLLPTTEGLRNRTNLLNGKSLSAVPLELYKVVDGIFCNRNFDFKILINCLIPSEKRISMTKLIQIQSDSRLHLQQVLLQNDLLIFKNQPIRFWIRILTSAIFKIIDYLSISNSAVMRVVNHRILVLGKIIYFFLHRTQNNPLKLNSLYMAIYLKNRNIKA